MSNADDVDRTDVLAGQIAVDGHRQDLLDNSSGRFWMFGGQKLNVTRKSKLALAVDHERRSQRYSLRECRG
jgi:hypothetical protein